MSRNTSTVGGKSAVLGESLVSRRSNSMSPTALTATRTSASESVRLLNTRFRLLMA